MTTSEGFKQVDCTRCSGSGTVLHERNSPYEKKCNYCEGTGKIWSITIQMGRKVPNAKALVAEMMKLYHATVDIDDQIRM